MVRRLDEGIVGTLGNDGGPIALVRSVIDGVLGVAKQVLGIVLGREDLKQEGQAQQDKADKEKNVAKKEAAAEAARAEAAAHETRQRGARKS